MSETRRQDNRISKVGATVKLLPVYGVDHYGTDLFIPIRDTLATTSITVSGTTITQNTDGGFVPVDEQDEILSDVDTIHFYNEGNDTEYDQTYRWNPDLSAIVYKLRVNIAFALNVSAYTSGTFDLTNVILTITQQPDSNTIFSSDIPVTMAGLTSATDAYFILDLDITKDFKIYSGQPIDIRLQTTTATGVGTFQVGVLPVFCYETAAVIKPFTSSGVTFHVHATLDHSDPVFNEDIHRLV